MPNIDFSLLLAAVGYTPMTNIPFLNTSTSSGGLSTPVDLLNALFTLSITIGAMLAVFMFIFGGLQMITARDNAGNVTAGKKKMANAVLGLLMLLSTFIVLTTINPQLTELKIFGDSLKGLNMPPSRGGGSPTIEEQAAQEVFENEARSTAEQALRASDSVVINNYLNEKQQRNPRGIQYILPIKNEDTGAQEIRGFLGDKRSAQSSCMSLMSSLENTNYIILERCPEF